MSTASNRVYVVDDEIGIRSFLDEKLRAAGLSVEAFESAESFLASIGPESRGCAIVDLFLEGMSGQELQQRLIARNLPLPIIFITGYGTVDTAVKAIRDGAVDFLEKPIQIDRLLTAVRTALAEEEAARARCDESDSVNRRLASLTDGERAVLDGMVAGKSYKKMAEDLDLSYKTVEARRGRVLKKMAAANVAELVRVVMSRNAE